MRECQDDLSQPHPFRFEKTKAREALACPVSISQRMELVRPESRFPDSRPIPSLLHFALSSKNQPTNQFNKHSAYPLY